MLQNRKRNNGAGNNEEETVSNTTTGSISDATLLDEVVCDILSRLPAKSLMRFKCVSKPWCSLVQDPYFINLHITRTKTLQRFFCIIPKVGSETENQIINYQDYQVYFKTTGLSSEESGRVASSIPTIRNLRGAEISEIIGPVNGLICFVNNFTDDDNDDAACTYNIFSREITPWIKSTVLAEARESNTCCYIGAPVYCFGYDPDTKKHKVMCMWNMSQKQVDGTMVDGPVCEVLTLGHNSWRKIEAAPPRHFDRTVCSVYVNGSIYWFPDMFECDGWNYGNDVFMVAFDVGSEKFRTIHISKFRSAGNRPSDPDPRLDRCQLLEVNGCVAILRRISADIAKLWVYEDSDKESAYKATTMESADRNWTENTITLPARWIVGRDFYFHTAGGTDQMILETHTRISNGPSQAVSIYSYDPKEKIFKEIKISGIPLSVPVCFCTRLCTSFCENLLSYQQPKESIPVDLQLDNASRISSVEKEAPQPASS